MTCTVTVANRGPDAATDVVVAEVRPTGTRRLVPRSSQSTRSGVRPAACRIGTLGAGESARITVRTTATTPGRTVNRVAALSSARDPGLRDNRARAALAVRPVVLPAVNG